MDQKELEERLALHNKWLRNEDGGARLDLRGANLRNADLWGADLRGANLRSANLQNANLRNADLQDANLWDANLWNAKLNYTLTSGAIGVTAICAQVNTSAGNRLITYYPTLDVVTAGCWQSSMAEFKQRVKDVYGDEEDGNAFLYARYQRVIAFLEQEAEADKEKDDRANDRQDG